MALDLGDTRYVVELLADVLADALERTTAGANSVLRLVVHIHPRQAGRQRRSFGLFLPHLRLRRTQRLELQRDGFEIGVDRLVEQAALFAMQLLAARGKLPALEHGHLM